MVKTKGQLKSSTSKSTKHATTKDKSNHKGIKNACISNLAQDIFGNELKSFGMSELDSEDALAFYKKNQILHLKGVDGRTSGMDVLCKFHKQNPSALENTWTVENAGNLSENSITVDNFLNLKGITKTNAFSNCYVSTILQDSKTSVNEFLSNFPFDRPPCTSAWPKYQHSLPLWLFMGRHLSKGGKGDGKNGSLTGRPEHTDSVSHDGTWHYQISGKKHWYVRPLEGSDEWKLGGNIPKLNLNITKKNESEASHLSNSMRIVCEPGDILIINTRLWWHRTELPFTDNAQDRISMSFARDFYCNEVSLPGKINPNIPIKENENDNDNEEVDEKFTNIDGIYAQANVKKGQVVLRESEMPDCSLPRSNDPNCEIGELDNGEGYLAALRDIVAGEFLSVAPSDDESDDESDDDGECEDEFVSESEEDETDGGF